MEPREYDVIVAGGGTAGSAAAVAAGRRGRRVLLVEEQNCLGGVSTAGGVESWFASVDGLGGVFDDVRRELRRSGGMHRNPRHFNPEHLKFVWQALAGEAGVRVLFHASVCGASRRNGRLRSVRVVSCSRMLSFRARFFIDATGEGDLGAAAGAAFMKGDPETGSTLHMSLAAWMYDTGRRVRTRLPRGLEPIPDEAGLPGLGGAYRADRRRIFLNSTKVVRADPTDPFQLADAEMEARRQLMRVVEYTQRTKFPTYALAASGATIGIREGRRIVGDHVLAYAEAIGRGRAFAPPDTIAVATSQIDFHSLTRQGGGGWREPVAPYGIPLRSIVARGFPNLLMAGKCISVDQTVHSSCRMTPTCCAVGQAAGTAAALAVEGACADVRDIDIALLRRTLAAGGMELDPARHRPFFQGAATRLDPDDVLPPGAPRPRRRRSRG